MTPSLSGLTNAQPYQGNGSIFVGNGCCLPITHTDSSSMSTLSGSLPLRNVLCVPSLTKNLHSIQRFAFDYKCVFLLDSDEHFVKDKPTGKLLLHGPNSRSLYHVPGSSSPSTFAFIRERVSSSVWHARLDHPSPSILRVVLADSLFLFVVPAFPSPATYVLWGSLPNFRSHAERSLLLIL